MKWSLPIGRILGIRIGIHLTFLLLLAWVGWAGWQVGGVPGSLWTLALVILLFLCVILHELGHSVVAMRFGIEVRSITLLPIGGVAAMKAIPEEPRKELLIAVAGPLVNVVIVTVLGAFFGWPSWTEMSLVPAGLMDLIAHITRVNILLVVFNLIPAFPMDGGRVLRSLLASVISYERATAWATGIGQFVAVGFFFIGLLSGHLILMLIAVFVFFGAEGEDRMVRIKGALKGVRVDEVMFTDFVPLHPDDDVRRCLDHFYHRKQEDFPVMDGDRLVGILPRASWLEALHTGEPVRVAELMDTHFVALRPDADLSRIILDLWSFKQPVYPVLEQGRLLGLLSSDDIGRYLMVQKKRPPSSPAGGSSSNGLTVDLG